MKKVFLFLSMVLLTMGAMAKNPVMAVMGDSYSAHGDVIPQGYARYYPVFYSTTGVQETSQMWWSLLAGKLKYEVGSINAYSGSTICNTGYGGQDFSNQSFVNRVALLGNPDVIFILGGTNDAWANSPLGDYVYSDWSKSDLFKFRPALAYLFSSLKKTYTNAKIYFILNDNLKSEIDESVKTICKKCSVPVVELKNIDKEADHPTIQGMEQIASQVAKFVKRQK